MFISYMQEQVQSALYVLSDMLDTFETWLPQHYDFLPESSQEHYSQKELEDAKDQFAGTKIRLELGTYT